MSTNEYEDDYDTFDDEFDETPKKAPKGLRDALKAEKARNKELSEQLAKVQGNLAKRTVSEVLASKGANPKLAKWVIKDLDNEIDDDAVAKWLDENGELFGFEPSSSEEVDVGEVNEASRAVNAAQGSAPTPTSDQLAAIAAAGSEAELAAALEKAGMAG
jgi:hypothetical protein